MLQTTTVCTIMLMMTTSISKTTSTSTSTTITTTTLHDTTDTPAMMMMYQMMLRLTHYQFLFTSISSHCVNLCYFSFANINYLFDLFTIGQLCALITYPFIMLLFICCHVQFNQSINQSIL